MSVLSGHTINRPVWIFILGCGLLLSTSGCSTILTVAYLFHPEDVPAEYSGLRGKHVVVVCKPIVELEFTDAGTARELAERIGANIRENVRGVKIISQQEVSRWLDENAWVDYPTLGKSVDADLVVGIDLDHFSLHEGSTLYRGRTTIHMQVHDIKDDLIVLDKRWTISYSPRTHGHRESSTRADDKKPKQEGGTHASQDWKQKEPTARGEGEGESFDMRVNFSRSSKTSMCPDIVLKCL